MAGKTPNVPDQTSTRERYSVSLVSQGNRSFYTLTMPSDVLAMTTFVTKRDEDPAAGFQRALSETRAKEIAEYIDNGFGTIPNSIVLSAQEEAQLEYSNRNKTIEFTRSPKAFLILDGQHRVYGYRLARSSLRVPVVIYNGLSRREEARLFIDINTKQRPVPNELLLDIKRLADDETAAEGLLRDIYDLYHKSPDSPLLGLLSPSERVSGKLSRVTFNNAMAPVFSSLRGLSAEESYSILRDYIAAVCDICEQKEARSAIVNPTTFRAFMAIFPEIAEKVRDRYNSQYTQEHFEDVLKPVRERLKKSRLASPGRGYTAFASELSALMRQSFSLR